jgi:starch phosphorylase
MAAPSDTQTGTVAYFSMEMALDPRIPTYAGGLGVLAGDTLRAAADLGVPMVGITLVHRKGYFRQRLDAQGRQLEEADAWDPAGVLERLDTIVPITIEGRRVLVGAWRHWVPGVGGSRIPVYLLDTAVPENSAADQSLTDGLYAGDDSYRLAQEVVLGYGGVALLEGGAQGHVETYHMNEGHSALLALALVERLAGGTAGVIADARPPVRVHDPHAGSRGSRSVSPRPGRPRAGSGSRPLAHDHALLFGRQPEHDVSRVAFVTLRQRRRNAAR